MRNTEWPKEEVQRLARSAGKPLEVTCAQQFLSAGWKARLGSYFTDGELKTLRELDVLAQKEVVLAEREHTICRVRATVSCRGFPPERSPLAYSVSTGCVPSFAPCLLSSHRGRQSNGALAELEAISARRLLSVSGLEATRPLVAFDMMERVERTRKTGKEQTETTVSFVRCKDGDHQLFMGVDSCVKAAFYWTQQDYSEFSSGFFVTLNVPVCILSVPFWDVCLDDGTVGEPVIRQRGYQTSLYPSHPATQEVMALVWAEEECRHLVRLLDDLLLWLRDTVLKTSFGERWAKAR